MRNGNVETVVIDDTVRERELEKAPGQTLRKYSLFGLR